MSTLLHNINSKNRAALFDLDGVLIDTENIYRKFWSEIDDCYPTGVEQFSRVIKGMNLQEILGNFFPDKVVQNEVKQMLENFQHDMQYNCFPGALELVGALRDSGFITCVVTSSDHKKMEELYNQHPTFTQSFDIIVTGDMVSNAKPHPECFLLAADMAGCNINDCIVFEDSLNGLKAGRASGAKVIGLTTTYDSADVAPLCDLMIEGLHVLNVQQVLKL